MNWGELKKRADQLGIKDDTEILSIDWLWSRRDDGGDKLGDGDKVVIAYWPNIEVNAVLITISDRFGSSEDKFHG